MKKHHLLYLTLALFAGFSSCKKEDDSDDDTTGSSVVTGWNGSDDPNSVPSAVDFGNGQTVPSSYDLIPKFPPVGDQGQYGTCVAWASGYNLKSAIEGMDRALTTSQLASAANQISPRDLFTAIPDADKGPNCNGTNFNNALDLLLNRGAATQQTVPYNNLNGCTNANLQANWTQEADNHKIKSYRKIALTAASIKENIANNVPVLCGAKLSDNFMTWNDGNVMTANTTYNQTGIHSYHALIIAGYDDNKGPNGAFRIINSWSPNWGDAGYLWVDYNFFVNEFCYGGNVYIAVNKSGNNPPPTNDSTITGSVDLASWAFSDVSNGFNSTVGFYEREIDYNIYNIGDQSAVSSQNWTLAYIYYNAYNANDYGFLFFDEFTNSVTAGSIEWQNDHYAINMDIPAGDNFGNVAFQSLSVLQQYYVPNITGAYYLVMIADAYDVFGEQDEQNNLFYTTDQYPVDFINGEVQRNSKGKPVASLQNYNFKNSISPNRATLKNSPYSSAVNKTYPNAYSFDEINRMIRQQKNSGQWNQKLKAFKAAQKLVKGKK